MTPADPKHSDLTARLQAGDQAGFAAAFRELSAPSRHSTNGPLTAMVSQSELAADWLTEIACDKNETIEIRGVAFHTLRYVGAGAMIALRKGYDRPGQTGYGRGRIHMCMMDIVNGPTTNRAELPAVAAREIPLWIETLNTAEPMVQLWAVTMLASLLPHAPAELVEPLRSRLSDFVAGDFMADNDNSARGFAMACKVVSTALSKLPSINGPVSAISGTDSPTTGQEPTPR
jgi:hypothetical protein